MNLSVIGTGYVGLVTGICFAEVGNHVICVDIDVEKINKLRKGEITIFEPNLDKMLQRNIDQGRLIFSTEVEDAVNHSDIIFLALPTPPGEDGSADLTNLLSVAESIGKIIKEYKVIVNKSTVPVGTCAKVHEKISRYTSVSFDVVSNPEFLREGDAVNDFMKPDRVVVGTSSPKAAEIMRELYLPFVRQGNPILFMDEASSELTKYAANAFLATKISFMNEIANMCEMLGADVDMVRLGIGSDDRIGKRFLFAGVGYGGSCFPKDVDALKRTSEQIGYDFKILGAVKEANVFQRKSFFKKINEFYSKDLKGKKFAIWGLAFKPNTDDIREAPSLYIIKKLLEAGAEVSAYDPEAMNNVKKVLKNKIHYAENPYDCLNNADALVIMTEWSIFRTPDFQLIKSDIKDKVIFDGRNLYEVNKIKQLGLKYFSIGRNSI
jgi:UDPglucose 6-dehydrogenase